MLQPRSMRSVLPVCFAGLVVALVGLLREAGGEEKKDAPKSSPEAKAAFNAAGKLFQAGKLDQGIAALERFVVDFGSDPLAPNARELLRENGAGKEVRVALTDRKFFREELKLPERAMLEQTEKILKDLRRYYSQLKTVHRDTRIRVELYDSQARYRKLTKSLTSDGQFRAVEEDTRTRKLLGEIRWYFPRPGGSVRDRQTQIQSLLYHEFTHYLNRVHFSSLLPSLMEEGLATWMQCEFNTAEYEGFRSTDRLNTQSEARNGLNTISNYKSFVSLLESRRGFDRGDSMIQRWYALGYAIVDFFAEGEIEGKRGSIGKLLVHFERLAQKQVDESGGASRPRPQTMQTLLESLVQETYGVDLEVFHAALHERILKTYKQR